jgi:pre-mRNA-processing factor 6
VPGSRGHEHDKGNYSDSVFDKWSGFNDKPFKATKYDSDDLEADEVYETIQDYMDQRKKRLSSTPLKNPQKRKEITAGEILSELKPSLATITDGNL